VTGGIWLAVCASQPSNGKPNAVCRREIDCVLGLLIASAPSAQLPPARSPGSLWNGDGR